MSTQTRRGVVLFAHGSRDPLWHRPMEAVRNHVMAMHPTDICLCAYLEISIPSLPEAIDQMAEAGCSEIAVLPLFLGTGRHAREDLPLLMQAAQSKHPSIHFTTATAVGEDDRVIHLLAQIASSLLYKDSKS